MEIGKNSNKSVIAIQNAAEIKAREENRKAREADKAKRAEEAAGESRRTEREARSKARRGLDEAEARIAKVSRNRRAREIEMEQEAGVGFFNL